MRRANIFDPIETNLDQRIFDGIEPRRSVQKFIQKVYYHALDRKLGVVGTEWADLYFTGSLTTYQYSQTSDADISVFPDYEYIWKHLNIDPQSARRILIEMSIHYLDGTFLPGTQHPLQFFVVPYGTLPGDLYQPGLRSAYNLLDHHWLVPPERNRSHDVQQDMPEAFERAEDIADKLRTMLDSGSTEEARELWHTVHAKRQLDQRAGLGDYSEGNIVYKWLLHEGLFDRIRDELGEYIAKTAKIPSDDELHRLLISLYDSPEQFKPDEFGRVVQHLYNPTPEESQEIGLQVVHIIRQWKINNDEMDDRARAMQQNRQQAIEQAQAEYKEKFGQYEELYNQLTERFAPYDPYKNWIKPGDDDYELAIEDSVLYGRVWKIAGILGTGTAVWEDGEVGAADGIITHSDQLRELISNWKEQRPYAFIGWMEKNLKDDSPFKLIIREMEKGNIDPAQVAQSIGLQPGEYTAEISNEPGRFGAVDYSDGLGLNGPMDTTPVFEMPRNIEQRYIDAMECPQCGGNLRREKVGKVYCEHCGWRPRQSAVDHLWDERVTTKVIYDFDQDRIILGTQADIPHLTGDAKIVGEYDGGKVTLFEADKQWINPTYFRRLWHVSYPQKELKDVYFRRETGDEYKLRSLPRKRKSAIQSGDSEIDALIESFKDEKVIHLTGDISIEDLKDTKIATGLCHTLSMSFKNYAEKHDLEAWLPNRDTRTPEEFGYTDRTISGRAAHYWTYVKSRSGDTYGIDWTAAQYGYEDLPVVQKLTPSGWTREW